MLVAFPRKPGSVVSFWPNEPAGFTLLTDYGFDDVLDQTPNFSGNIVGAPAGWALYQNSPALVSRTSDAAATRSPSNVAQFKYPNGFGDGSAPGQIQYVPQIGATTYNEAYFGFYWKMSNPWQNHPVLDKICYPTQDTSAGNKQCFIGTLPDNTLQVTTQYSGSQNLSSNVNATVITKGAWHLIEVYTRVTPAKIKWWLDGLLQGDHDTDITDPPTPKLSSSGGWFCDPVWGGFLPTSKTEDDYFWYDHARVSAHL